MSKLTDKGAVVAGPTKDIEPAIARPLALEGGSVVVSYASSKFCAGDVIAAVTANARFLSRTSPMIPLPFVNRQRSRFFSPVKILSCGGVDNQPTDATAGQLAWEGHAEPVASTALPRH